MQLLCKLILFSAITLLTCNPQDSEDSCSPIDETVATHYMQITYPAAGDTVSLSNPAAVQFKFQKLSDYPDKMPINATLTVGKIDYGLAKSEAIIIAVKGEFTCAEIPWTEINIDQLSLSENEVVAAVFKVCHYDRQLEIYYTTETFYITK